MKYSTVVDVGFGSNRYQFGRHRMSHQVRSSLKADEDRNGKTLTISRGLFAFMLPPLNLP